MFRYNIIINIIIIVYFFFVDASGVAIDLNETFITIKSLNLFNVYLLKKKI